MLRKTLVYLKQNVLALLALIIAVGTGSAYAANTVFSADIVDGEVKSVDIANNSIHSGDILDNTINTFDVHSFLGVDVVDGSLTGDDVSDSSTLGPNDIFEESLQFNNTLIASDIASGAVGLDEVGSQAVGADEVVNDSLLQSDIRSGAITNDEVLDNSLIGADIDESTLTSTATAAFAGAGNVSLPVNSTFAKVVGRALPAGSYGIAATANVQIHMGGDSPPYYRDSVCELRNHLGQFIGGGRDRRDYWSSQIETSSISMNGGVTIPAGGGEVSLWCRFQDGAFDLKADGQMMIIRLGGFF